MIKRVLETRPTDPSKKVKDQQEMAPSLLPKTLSMTEATSMMILREFS